jgi:diguanylate cyclase (GGDEF)-like protein/PAS domain S-box-containing protein
MIKQAEGNFEALIESTQDLIWSVDLDHRLTLLNSSLRHRFQESYGIQLAVGMRIQDHLPAERAARWNSFYERALSDGPFRVEYKMSNGQTLDLAFNLIVIQGKTTGISVFGKDITERKTALKALREKEARHREAEYLACAGSSSWDVDSDTTIWSEGLYRITGRKPGTSAPSHAERAKIYTPESWARLDAAVKHTLATGEPYNLELQIVRPDGSLRWTHARGTAVRNELGHVYRLIGTLQDITEQNAAEETRALLASIVESSDDAIHAVNLDGTVTSWNRGAEVLFGYKREEIIGKNIAILAPPGRQEEVQQFLEFVAEGNPISPFDSVLRDKAGCDIDVSLSISPIKNSDGNVVGASAIARDNSQRMRFEQSLQEAERKYHDIVDGALEGIFQTSFDGRQLMANPALVRMMGYDSTEDFMDTVRDVAHDIWADPGERAKLIPLIEKWGAIRGFECRFKRKDGSVIWISLNARKALGPDGKTFIIEGFIQDITERKQAELQLHDSEERYRTVFQTGPNTALIARLSDGVIIDANQAFLDSTGFGRDQVIGSTALDLGIWVNPGDRQTLLDAVLSNTKRQYFEVLSRRMNGEKFWMRLSASLIEIGGVRCLLAFGQDISEAKAAEERLAAADNELRASEERYRTAFQMNLDAVDICHKENGMFVDVNDAFLRITGFEREDVIGHTAQEIGIWDNPQDRRKLLDALSLNSTCSNLEFPYRTKDGRLRLGRLSVTPIELDGTPCILSVTRDVTEANEARKHLAKAQEALRASEEHYRTIFQTSIDGIAISRMDDGKFIDVNQAFLNIVKYEREEIVGRTSTELGVWSDELIRQDITEVLRRDSYFRNLTIPYKRKNGEIFWIHLSASAIELDGVPCILSIIRDTSEIRAAEERIKDLSYRDPLTHLPNRRMLLERLLNVPDMGAEGTHKRALLLINLDDFKKLNDAHGNQIGDLLLQEVGRRLIACVRGADTVARCGGDDFAVLLDDLGNIPEPAASQAKIVAEKIRTALSQTYMLDGRECHSPCSIGITVFGDEPKNAHQIFQQAELAMRQARVAGRNTTHFFDPALQSAANARAAIEEDLYKAIKTNQFVLYYQPQVEEGRLIGVECLIRWNHPTRGLMNPAEFIPMTEESGLILPLGDWVLNTACEQIAAWSRRRQMKDIPVAVNISARQFRQPEFVELALAALYRTGANPHNLKLELTESMLRENIEEVIAKMTELKSHGLRFSLDDFGVGYSSLSYLKRLPLDQLKIDISFVRDILVDASSGAIAQTIVSLGQVMSLSVIAEGVETEEQRDFLVRLGCRAFQGYLFSKPLPLEEFERQWLTPTPRSRLRRA